MSETIWEFMYPAFTPLEKWGDAAGMSGFILLAMYALRQDVGCPIVIHAGKEDRASGFHPKGVAVDFHFSTDQSLLSQADAVESFLVRYQLNEFVGLGLYPTWRNPGFHLDARGTRARWGWLGAVDAKGGRIYAGYEDTKAGLQP